jgi:hypothetical protein
MATIKTMVDRRTNETYSMVMSDSGMYSIVCSDGTNHIKNVRRDVAEESWRELKEVAE